MWECWANIVGALCECCWNPVGILLFFGLLWECCETTTGTLWEFCGTTVEKAVKMLWECCVNLVGMLWGGNAVGIVWECCGTAVRILWGCCENVVGMLWECCRNAVGMQGQEIIFFGETIKKIIIFELFSNCLKTLLFQVRS